MIHQEYFDKLIHKMTDEPFRGELKTARLEYTKAAGEVFEDDKSFDIRMNSFLEWYILDRPMETKHKTPIQIYLSEYSESMNGEEREFLNGLAGNLHSIFEVKRHERESIKVEDIFTSEKYLVTENNGHQGFRSGDILEARLFPFKGSYFFTNAFCFHLQGASKFIKGELKKMKKEHLSTAIHPNVRINGKLTDFILRLSYMSLKYERARQTIDVNDIYR